MQNLTKISQQEFDPLPKILCLDIESSPSLIWAYSLWNANAVKVERDPTIMSISWQWVDMDKTRNLNLSTMSEEELARHIWDLYNQADYVLGHNNCVHVDTPVLKQDLTWSRAGDLRVGDKVMGFEEGVPPGETRRTRDGQWKGIGRGRRVEPATVTDFKIRKEFVYEVEFDNGDKIKTTGDHYWLSMAPKSRDQQWRTTNGLRPGYRVRKIVEPWETPSSYEAGWLAGFLDGEGTIARDAGNLQFCQRKNAAWRRAVEYCELLGLDFFHGATKSGGLGKGDALYSWSRGGKWRNLKTIGALQAVRLIGRIDWNLVGDISRGSEPEDCTIVSITPIGYEDVAVMGTSSKTYIAGGYPMHNCNFDTKMINALFMRYDLTPPSPYKQIDTLKVARSVARFNSNRLDSLGKLLLGEGKTETTYKDLWYDCLIKNDKKSWKLMAEYNNRDVDVTVALYKKLRPWIHNHPNIGDHTGIDGICPKCGSDNIRKDGSYRKRSGRVQRYKCLHCGGWSSEASVKKEGRLVNV